LSALAREAIESVDRDGMTGDVLDQPSQLRDALWRADSAGIAQVDAPGGLVVCGMGGSAVGGDLARAAIGGRATRPIATVRDYTLPSWFGADTLALCSSYSGDTEETLSLFEAAGVAGAPRVAVTTGGVLARLAREQDVPVMGVPGGMKPRASVAYGTVAALECAALCGAAPSLRDEVERAAALLDELVAEWGPDAPDDSPAKALATRLHGTVPVVYGAGASEPVATRWRTQFNENAKLPAFHAALPEADHNDILAWERAAGLAPLSAVFLDDPGAHPRTRKRVELTARIVERGAAAVERVPARGETPFEHVMSLVLLGDLISVYLAVLAGVDPSRMEAIERLKRDLES
jgi:glucose/mannose-6-phosphate isomerase